MKAAVITGVTGQDGSYLAEFLLAKNYKVFGIVRRSSSSNKGRISHITNDNFEMIESDMCDPMTNNRILNALEDYDQIEIYNLAAQSHVQTSFEQPMYTFQVNALGVMGWLESIRQCPFSNKVKFYQAGTSEMFGKVIETPQSENTPFYPRSPYGVSKVAAYWACKNYRESYGMFVCNGILFNHESERRGDNFVTKKITNWFAGDMSTPLELGNLDAKRDWGYAPDYVEGMWMMMQQDIPDDFILATGETHSVKEFLEEVMIQHGITWKWVGDNVISGDRVIVRLSDKFKRPAEVDLLLGDPSKAINVLGWKSNTSFKDLVAKMIR
jgi:GDPmannose 4,6-dehydratase